MIKLFRHIRKSMITENKTTKYFKYAIGEIVLVVIGILIALQINNWNQNRLLKNDEVIFVKQLLEDAKADALFFRERLYKLKTQSHFYNNLINYCKGLPIKKDTIAISDINNQPFIKLANQSKVLKNNPNAYEQLLSPLLKTELQKYASKYEFVYRSIEFFNIQMDEYFTPLRITHYNKMPDIGEVNNYQDLSFLCQKDENLAIIQLLESNANNAARHTDEFVKINTNLIEKLQHFLDNNND